MNKMWFKSLSPEQVILFRSAARKGYKVFTPIDGLWHPSYQHECVLMNYESAVFVEEKQDDDTPPQS
jgi:hypothetical protein